VLAFHFPKEYVVENPVGGVCAMISKGLSRSLNFKINNIHTKNKKKSFYLIINYYNDKFVNFIKTIVL